MLLKFKPLAQVALLATLTMACQKREAALAPAAPSQVPPAAAPQGGIDSSGGDAGVSAEEDVKNVAKALPVLLQKSLVRLEMSRQNRQNFYADIESGVIQLEEGETISDAEKIANKDFLRILGDFFSDQNLLRRSLKELIVANRIEFVVEESCVDEHGRARDGSATKLGSKVCFNPKRLSRIPLRFLAHEMLALTFHEIAHVYGYDERDAKLVQKMVHRIILDSVLPIDRASSLVTSAMMDLNDALENLGETINDDAPEWTSIREAAAKLNARQSAINYTLQAGALIPLSQVRPVRSRMRELTDKIATDSMSIELDAKSLAATFKELEEQHRKLSLHVSTFLTADPKLAFDRFDYENEKVIYKKIFFWMELLYEYGVNVSPTPWEN